MIIRLLNLIFLCLIFFSIPSHSNEKTVGLWTMMLWFNDGNYKPGDQYVRYHPANGSYNSWDVQHIELLIKNAEDMDVDYLILDKTNGAFRHGGNFDKTIKAVLQRIKYHKSNLKVSIAIGSGIWRENNLQYLQDEIVYIEKYFKDPQYFYVDGKPLLILYINPEYSIYSASKDSTLKVYMDKNDSYGFRNYFSSYTVRYASGADDWLNDQFSLYGWKFGLQKRYFPTLGVMPGWNRFHNELTGSTPTERENGDFFIQSWEAALSKNPNNIVITSWDDFAEETFIAPTLEYGDLYVNISRKYIKIFKEMI